MKGVLTPAEAKSIQETKPGTEVQALLNALSPQGSAERFGCFGARRSGGPAAGVRGAARGGTAQAAPAPVVAAAAPSVISGDRALRVLPLDPP